MKPRLAVIAFAAWLLAQAAAGQTLAAPDMSRAPAAPGSESVHVHRAAAGDTLIGLARRFLVEPQRWPELQRLNRIAEPRRIAVGTPIAIPLVLMRVEQAPAQVLSASGSVSSGGRSLSAGDSLSEGARLETGADGQTSLRLVDGTVLRLRGPARVQIDRSSRVPAAGIDRSGVQLEQGRVEVQTPRGGKPGFRIGTPQGVLAVRGTEFRVAAETGVSRNEVLQGTVGASGAAKPGSETAVAGGFGTSIDASGSVAVPTLLLPAPDLAGLPALHERVLVRLPLPPLPRAAAWRVQVARDAGFEHLLADVRSSGNELRIAGLPDGRHPIRVRAIDAAGLEGLDASGQLLLKARPEPPLPRAPAPRAQIVGDRVELAWTGSTEAARYRVQIARAQTAPVPAATDADGSDPATFAVPLQDVRDVSGESFAASGLAPGRYAWRVASVRADGDQGPFGDAQSFETKPPPPPPPNPPAASAPAVGDQGVRLFWQRQPGLRYELQLAADSGFAQPLVERTLDESNIELPLPGVGRFYLRLRSRDRDGFVGPWSAVQYFDVFACVRDAANACVRTDGGPLRAQ